MSQITYANKNTGDQFTAADANEIKTVVNGNALPPILEALPDPDATKAGQDFILAGSGTRWTYARAGQFGSLAEGTPWPVKGYKEALISFYEDSGNIVHDVKINDFSQEIVVTTPSKGTYRIDDQEFNLNTDVVVSQGSIEENFLYYGNVDAGGFFGDGITFMVRRLADSEPQSIEAAYQRLTARILKYPPTT